MSSSSTSKLSISAEKSRTRRSAIQVVRASPSRRVFPRVPSSRNDIHPASLLPIHTHNEELLELVASPVTKDMITHVARVAETVVLVDDQQSNTNLPSPPVTPTKTHAPSSTERPATLPSLQDFITRLCIRSGVQVPTLLSTLIIMHRLRDKIPRVATGIHSARHRVFLATLIVAAKYLNDGSPRNKHWAEHAGIFELREVNLMEIQLLELLSFDIAFTEKECLAHFRPFFASSIARANAVKRVTKGSIARLNSGLPIMPPHDVITPPPSRAQDTLPELPLDLRSISLSSSVGSLTDDNGSSSAASSSSSCSDDDAFTLHRDPYHPSLHGALKSSRSEFANNTAAATGSFKLNPVPSSAYRLRRPSPSLFTTDADLEHAVIDMNPPSPSPARSHKRLFYVLGSATQGDLETPPPSAPSSRIITQKRNFSSSSSRTINASSTPRSSHSQTTSRLLNLPLPSATSLPVSLAHRAKESFSSLWNLSSHADGGSVRGLKSGVKGSKGQNRITIVEDVEAGAIHRGIHV